MAGRTRGGNPVGWGAVKDEESIRVLRRALFITGTGIRRKMLPSKSPMDNANPRTSEECLILDDGCALRRFLDLFCNRWTSLSVNALARDTRRFGELQRTIPGISKKMLSETLRNLEEAGFVKRVSPALMPSHVEYSHIECSLTELDGNSCYSQLANFSN